MSIPRLAIERPITMFMLSAVVMLIGGLSLARLPVDVIATYGTPSNPGYSLLDIGAGATYQYVYGAVAQPDGKLVLAVQQANGGTGDFVIARVQAGGERDPSFGTNGVVSVDLEPTGVYDMTIGIALQYGRPVVLGQSKRSASNPQIEASLVRLGNDGMFANGFE